MPSNGRGYRGAGKWSKRKALKRAGYRCAECGATQDLQVHHIVPVSVGGGDNQRNLQVLCDKCHRRAHGKPPKGEMIHAVKGYVYPPLRVVGGD